MRPSMAESIGRIMNGIEARPTAVGINLTYGCAPLSLDAFRSAPVPQQIRFMVNPGTTTLARSCQIRVSPENEKNKRIFSKHQLHNHLCSFWSNWFSTHVIFRT